MKKIIKLLLQTLLLLSVTSLYASVLAPDDLNEPLSQDQVKHGVNDLLHVLDKHYIFPEKTLLIKKRLKHKLTINSFNEIADWHDFMRHLNAEIKSASGDMFLDIVETKSPFIFEKSPHELSSNPSFAKDKVRILAGNVGYFRLDHFSQNLEAETDVSTSLDKLSKVDALIIDLRHTEGESISLALHLMSYFVEEGTILSEMIYDKNKKIEILKATENHGHIKFKQNFPLYILTSAFLSSSGEFISYTLKHLDKAVIVGEETMGVAYVLQKKKINENISINLPIAIPLHPVTTTNWAKIGVIPDSISTVELSLEVAHKLAKAYLGRF